MRRLALTIAGLTAAATLLVPTAAYAETQVFEAEGGSTAQNYDIAWGQAEAAGYVKSQCRFYVTRDSTTITCTR